MPRYVFLNPVDYRQQYVTGLRSDPGVPAGWVLTSGSDGAPDAALITYMGGINSGGFPKYTGDPAQVAAQPLWINGICKDGDPSTT